MSNSTFIQVSDLLKNTLHNFYAVWKKIYLERNLNLEFHKGLCKLKKVK